METNLTFSASCAPRSFYLLLGFLGNVQAQPDATAHGIAIYTDAQAVEKPYIALLLAQPENGSPWNTLVAKRQFGLDIAQTAGGDGIIIDTVDHVPLGFPASVKLEKQIDPTTVVIKFVEPNDKHLCDLVNRATFRSMDRLIRRAMR